MPPSAHHFAPVWPVGPKLQTFRSKQYAPTKKRKRHDVEESDENDDDDDDESDRSVATLKSEVPSTKNRIALKGEARKDPFNVAGHVKGEILPSPFPHGPIAERNSRIDTTQKDLSELKPPLYIPPPDESDRITSLRRHHLSVLTTILHTSLQKSDFLRAGRAWGLILRSEMHGKGIDVRTQGRWGIGAEILLRQQSTQLRSNTNDFSPLSTSSHHYDEARNDHPGAISISPGNFEAAKAYYERLILEFPYRKMQPHKTSALTFYPAMFSLCIAEIQAKCTRKPSSRRSTPSDHDSDTEEASNETNALKTAELDLAVDLAARMDELMLSPPYDTYPPLLQLRAMVALWVGDLCRDVAAESREEEARNEERAVREGKKAEKCLKRLQDAGCDIPEIVAHVLK